MLIFLYGAGFVQQPLTVCCDVDNAQLLAGAGVADQQIVFVGIAVDLYKGLAPFMGHEGEDDCVPIVNLMEDGSEVCEGKLIL